MPGEKYNKPLHEADSEQMKQAFKTGGLIKGVHYTPSQIQAVALHNAIGKNNRHAGFFKYVMCCFGGSASGKVVETNGNVVQTNGNKGADNECGPVVEMTV
jgi:hypothetical protein